MKYHHILFILSCLSLNAQISANLDELTKAILLKDCAKISKLLAHDQAYKKDQITDKIIVFAMDNNLPGNTILELVLKAGFSVHHEFSNGTTLTQLALTQGDIALVISLMEYGISFYNEQDCGYYHHNPIQEYNVPLTKALLKHGYGTKFILNSCTIRTHCLFYSDENKQLILNDEAFKLLLQAGFAIDEYFSKYHDEQQTLLFFMIQNRCMPSEIQKIINLGANVNVPCKAYNGYDYSKNTYIYKEITPLAMAVGLRKDFCYDQAYTSNLDKIIEILVHHGATL